MKDHNRCNIRSSARAWADIVMRSAIALLAIVLTLRVIASFSPGGSGSISAWLTFVATLILAAITFCYAKHTRDMARTTHKSAQGDMLLRLSELYADKRTADAIRFMYAFKEAEDRNEPPTTGKSRYLLGQAYCVANKGGSEGDLHRWHLTNFWYTVAILRDEEIIDDKLIQARFGSSLDVIDILEPIEAVRSYRLWEKGAQTTQDSWEGPAWPAWNLYARYRDKPLSKTIPVDNDDFKAWVSWSSGADRRSSLASLGHDTPEDEGKDAMPTTLSAGRASVDQFLREARCCAACEHGFAAMLTAFSVLLALQEATMGQSDIDSLVGGFVPLMRSKNKWFHSPMATPNDQVIVGALVELRNALAHELSMPTGVKMVNTASQASTAQQQWPGSHVVSVVEFVEDVGATALAIVAENPNAVMDPSQAGRLQRGSISMPRSPATREDLFDKTSGSSST